MSTPEEIAAKWDGWADNFVAEFEASIAREIAREAALGGYGTLFVGMSSSTGDTIVRALLRRGWQAEGESVTSGYSIWVKLQVDSPAESDQPHG